MRNLISHRVSIAEKFILVRVDLEGNKKEAISRLAG